MHGCNSLGGCCFRPIQQLKPSVPFIRIFLCSQQSFCIIYIQNDDRNNNTRKEEREKRDAKATRNNSICSRHSTEWNFYDFQSAHKKCIKIWIFMCNMFDVSAVVAAFFCSKTTEPLNLPRRRIKSRCTMQIWSKLRFSQYFFVRFWWRDRCEKLSANYCYIKWIRAQWMNWMQCNTFHFIVKFVNVSLSFSLQFA